MLLLCRSYHRNGFIWDTQQLHLIDDGKTVLQKLILKGKGFHVRRLFVQPINVWNGTGSQLGNSEGSTPTVLFNYNERITRTTLTGASQRTCQSYWQRHPTYAACLREWTA